jgi:hypothetical protein
MVTISIAQQTAYQQTLACLFTMRQFYRFFEPQYEIVPQPVGQISLTTIEELVADGFINRCLGESR